MPNDAHDNSDLATLWRVSVGKKDGQHNFAHCMRGPMNLRNIDGQAYWVSDTGGKSGNAPDRRLFFVPHLSVEADDVVRLAQSMGQQLASAFPLRTTATPRFEGEYAGWATDTHFLNAYLLHEGRVEETDSGALKPTVRVKFKSKSKGVSKKQEHHNPKTKESALELPF